jgi:hypothetical protein
MDPPYPMLKIRHPSKAPMFLQCQYKQQPNVVPGAQAEVVIPPLATSPIKPLMAKYI